MGVPAPIPAPPAPGYVPALDGVRALAITLVMASHAVMPGGFGGALGVDVFFVLSGYLITTLLLREHAATGRLSLRRFYGRRAVRILPPLVIMLACLVIPLGAVFGWGTAIEQVMLALFYLMPFKVQADAGAGPLGHTWSLGVEEWFYLVWPALLVLFLARRRGVRWAVGGAAAGLAALLVAARVTDLELGQASYLFRSFGLMAGCLLALALHARPVRVPRWVGAAGLVPIAAAVWWSSAHGPSAPAAAMTDAGAALLIASLAGGAGGLSRMFSWAPARYLGRISYEVYLWHFPLFMLLSRGLGVEFRDVAWIAVPGSLLLATVSYRLTAPWSTRLRARLRNTVPSGWIAQIGPPRNVSTEEAGGRSSTHGSR